MPRIKISPQTMTRAVSGIDRMINRIPRRTQQSIRSLFFLAVICGAIGAGVWGGIKGNDAARIKSAPLINFTNDVFEVDVKREHTGGNFSSMLDSDTINEMKRIETGKLRFSTRTNLEPEADRSLVEPEADRAVKVSPGVRNPEPLIEGDYRSKDAPPSDVRPVEKRGGSPVREPDAVIEKEQGQIEPLPEREAPAKPNTTFRRDTDVPQLEKKKPVRGADIRDPGPLDREGGIIKD
jgi:hypothetical protein